MGRGACRLCRSRATNCTLTEEQAIAACRGQIASYKVPQEVRFVAESDLKRSASGKIIRRDMEAMLKTEIERLERDARPPAHDKSSRATIPASRVTVTGERRLYARPAGAPCRGFSAARSAN